MDRHAAHAHFRSLVRQLVDFDEPGWAVLLAALRARELSRDATLLHAGQVCGDVAFIHRGLFRIYLLKDGRDVTCDLRLEGDFVTDYASFLTGRPSAYSIVALEPAEVLTFDRAAMLGLYGRLDGSERLGRLIAERLFVETVSRASSFVSQRPTERYRALIEERPLLLQRVSQLHLATYLGVTPESLSRIRRRLSGGKPRSAEPRRRK